MELEIVHGKNMIHAASHQLATLDRFVLSTLSDTAKWSKGEFKWNLHFDGKAHFEQHLKQHYPELAKRSSYLQMGSYLSNRVSEHVGPKRQEDGSFVIRRLGIANGKPIPYVNPPNDTGHFVRALVLSPKAPPGSSMLGFCGLMTNEEFCALWGKVHGVQCRFQPLGYEDAVKVGMQEWMAEEVSQSGLYTTKYGWHGGDPEMKHPEELGVEVGKLTSVEGWIRGEDWGDVM